MKKLAIHLFAVLSSGLLFFTGCSQTEDPAAPAGRLLEVVQQSVRTAGANCVTASSDLIGWWPGDGNANDIVSGNHGTLQNGTAFGLGIVAQAFSLDGVDDFVSINNFNALDGLSNATFEFWVKMNAFPSDPRCNSGSCGIVLFSKNDFVFAIGIHSSLAIEVSRGNGSNWGGDFTLSNGALTGLNQWNHVAVVVDGTTDKIYINGVLNTTNTQVENSFANFGGLVFGSGFSGNYIFLDAELDEITIYKRVLSADEIQAIFNAGSAGKCKKVTICHKPGTPAQKTLVIPIRALSGHLGHGDTIGPCQ
jgi:hypothetical protein